MIGFNEALSIMNKYPHEFDYCTEHENAYVFSKMDELSFGGTNSPAAVMKAGGECCNFVSVIGELGDEIREGYIKDWLNQ